MNKRYRLGEIEEAVAEMEELIDIEGDIGILQYRENANSFLFLLLFFFSVKKKRSVTPCEISWLL